MVDCATNSRESDAEIGSTKNKQLTLPKKSLPVGELSSGEESDVELSGQPSRAGSELEYDNDGVVGSSRNRRYASRIKPVTCIPD